MDVVTIVGLSAALLSTASLFPQLVKIWRSKSTKDISMGMFAMFSIGVLLWFIYGVLLNNLPIIIANFFGFIQAAVILYYKIKYH